MMFNFQYRVSLNLQCVVVRRTTCDILRFLYIYILIRKGCIEDSIFLKYPIVTIQQLMSKPLSTSYQQLLPFVHPCPSCRKMMRRSCSELQRQIGDLGYKIFMDLYGTCAWNGVGPHSVSWYLRVRPKPNKYISYIYASSHFEVPKYMCTKCLCLSQVYVFIYIFLCI